MDTKVVLEGCLGDWSKRSYIKNLAEKARQGEIELYAVDTRDLRDEEIEDYEKPTIFINKKTNRTYDTIGNVDFVFIVTPHETHCKIAEHWLKEGRLNENGRIFIEKPLDSSVENIEELGKYEKVEEKIIAIDHYIPKIIPLMKKLEETKGKCGKIKRMRFNMLQSELIPESRKKTLNEGLILDMFPHVLAVFTKVMKICNNFELDDHDFEITGIRSGRYEGSPIIGETFAEIAAKIGEILLESCIGKAVGIEDNKTMEISFKRGFVVADFTSEKFSIGKEDRSEDICGKLQKDPMNELLDDIINRRFDENKFLKFSEGVKIVKIISRMREEAGESIKYEKTSSLDEILMKFAKK